MADFNSFKTGFQKMDPLTLVRSLIILEMVTLSFSTAATVVIEILVFICFISFKQLRQRVLAASHQPMVIMALILYAMVSIGVLYSAAPLSESVDMWGSWRKLLLVPLVASVYNDSLWKQRMVSIFIVLMALSALISFACHALDVGRHQSAGIVLGNHATQGMLFSVAMFACLVLVRFPFSREVIPSWFLKVSAVILFLNILMITPGRSGYLVLMVLIMTFVFWGIQKKIRWVILVLAPLVILALLLASPVAKNRIFLGMEEMRTYKNSPEITSMGIRMVMWKNTLDLLKKFEHPVLGYGTSGFETAYKPQVGGKEGWQGKPVGDPHNQYLLILVEYGIVGLIIFLLFIFSFFRQPVKGSFHIMAIGVLLAWCATSMFNGHFTTFSEGRSLMIWCSALLSVNSSPKEEDQDSGPAQGTHLA
jgi:O-antigen ligase